VVTARASVMGHIPQSNTTFKFSYSDTFNAPLIVLVMQPGVVVQKEKAQNYSAGIEQWFGKKYFLSSFFFYKDYDSYFSDAVDPVGTTDAYAMGVESIVKLFPWKWLSFQGSYSWARARDEVRDVPLPSRPNHLVKTSLTITPIERLTIRSDLKYVGKRFWGTNTGVRYVDWQGRVSNGILDAYVKWDVTGRYTFKFKNHTVRELTLFTTVDNILNQDYEEEYGRPLPGINFLSGFSGKFF
jgi:outer membrane receptor protein involved in Fe transport